jgi:hypothetical protein
MAKWFDKELKEIENLLEQATKIIEQANEIFYSLKETQEEKLDNVPESLIDSSNCQTMEKRLELFDECFDNVETLVDGITEIIDGIQNIE